MGGIQVILLGDFRQLPPLLSKWSQDTGAWAFQSENWNFIIPQVLQLTNVHRQDNAAFCTCINEVSRGHISDTSYTYWTLWTVVQNDRCIYFRNVLRWNSLHVPPVIAFKVNSPVIFTVNVSDKLVNGMNGYLKEIDENSVSVYFLCIKETLPSLPLHISDILTPVLRIFSCVTKYPFF